MPDPVGLDFPAAAGQISSMHTKTPDTQTFEAVVVGAGLVGLTLAHALASAGIEVAVIDHADPKTFTETAFDGRTTAVAEGSVRVLEGIGLWQGPFMRPEEWRRQKRERKK